MPPDALSPTPPGRCAVAPVELPHTAGPQHATRVYKLDPVKHPLALCNDGSPAAFLLRPGSGVGAQRWIIYLEGGGQCGDAAECAARYRGRRAEMTSSGLPDGGVVTVPQAGLKSPEPGENPDFYDATFVQVHYCSSDLWSGDAAAVPGAPMDQMSHWHFRGREILAEVVAELMPQGLRDATEVFLTGSSAGGVGVTLQVDDLRARLSPATRLVALQDAGFIIEYPPYDPVTQRESEVRPLPQEQELVAAAQAWGGRGDASCEAKATTEVERAGCRIPSRVLGGEHVIVPVFVRQSQLDAVQVKRLIDPLDTSAPASAFRERFAASMRGALAALAESHGVHSSHDSLHGVMNTTEGWTTLAVDGVTVRDAVGAWYRDPCLGDVRHIAP